MYKRQLLAPAGILFIFAGVIWLSESEVLRPYRNLVFAFLVGVNLLTCLNQPYNQNNFAYKDYDDTTTCLLYTSLRVWFTQES